VNDTRQQWSYFGQEILNVVSFLTGDGFEEKKACALTNRLLRLIARPWYVGLKVKDVQARYRRFEKKSEPRLIPPLPKLPRWQNAQAIIIPE
jgi:hypothetical protein